MKKRAVYFGMVVIFLLSCGKNLTTDNATSLIKNTFRLADKEKVEILGISKESKTVMLVKFRVGNTQFNSKMRKYDKGWQLEEVQNELGFWIPASSVVNLFDQSDKVRLAMTEINTIAICLMDYLTDNGVVPEQSGTYEENSPFYDKFVPNYVDRLPIKDPWGNNYRVYCGSAIVGKNGIKEGAADDFLVISYGKDGQQELWEYDVSNPEAGLFSDNDYDRDLINFDGSWIRAPKVIQKGD